MAELEPKELWNLACSQGKRRLTIRWSCGLEGHEHASKDEAAECIAGLYEFSAETVTSACIPGDADVTTTPAVISDAQVQAAVMEILIAEGALPRGVASFGKPLEDFARRLVEAVVGGGVG